MQQVSARSHAATGSRPLAVLDMTAAPYHNGRDVGSRSNRSRDWISPSSCVAWWRSDPCVLSAEPRTSGSPSRDRLGSSGLGFPPADAGPVAGASSFDRRWRAAYRGPRPTNSVDLRGRKILVVDDEETVRDLLCRVLDSQGCVVAFAEDGQQALAMIKTDRPDLVLLDLMMPVMDGWEVLRQLRDLVNPPPVLVVSAAARPIRERALREGAVECLAKPFGFARLIEACQQGLVKDRT